jgi:hypothetical protein
LACEVLALVPAGACAVVGAGRLRARLAAGAGGNAADAGQHGRAGAAPLLCRLVRSPHVTSLLQITSILQSLVPVVIAHALRFRPCYFRVQSRLKGDVASELKESVENLFRRLEARIGCVLFSRSSLLVVPCTSKWLFACASQNARVSAGWRPCSGTNASCAERRDRYLLCQPCVRRRPCLQFPQMRK